MSIKNLENEGFEKLENEVIQVGDVMYDAALFYSDKSRKPDFVVPEKFILTTCHRAENTDDPKKLANMQKSKYFL